jgi:membrane glycosyltransferase
VTAARRWAVLALAAVPTVYSAWLFVLLTRSDGWTSIDALRLSLSTLCVFWLSWGAFTGMLGLLARPASPAEPAPSRNRTAILMPIFNEDPPSTFARVAAISNRLTALGAHESFDLFILSDSQSLESAAREALWLERLLTDCPARERIFYRRRINNTGRKAGNVEDFIRRSGAAYTYALVLDADSLMEAETILGMVHQMDETPTLGLLQTLPTIIHARSIFGRAMQFATHLYNPVYSAGAAMLQGQEGPYWGHNAIFRIDAFAECCGLPELAGKPPFGGHVLSHDYVEAALLARGGFEVRLDPSIGGSFEEGPDNIIDFAKRDQRWCQGNLQHSRVLLAPQFKLWNRITLLQGIFSYLMPSLWLALLIVSIVAADLSRHTLFRAGPDWPGWALIAIVGSILIVPKLLITLNALTTGRAGRPSETGRILLSVFAEIVLSTIVAPIILMFQVRAVSRVIFGFDGGWPPSNRTDSVVTITQAWAGSWWIACCGGVGLAVVIAIARSFAIWSLPVALPMILAPLIIAWTSRPALSWLWQVSEETEPSPVIREWLAIHQGWTGSARAPFEQDFTTGGTANVLG